MNIGINHFLQLPRSFLSTVVTCILIFSSANLTQNAANNPYLVPASSSSPSVTAPDNTFVVNSTADAPDDNPSNGVCATLGGVCTLRAAIMEANFTSAPDNISLPAGVYLLTRPGYDDGALIGDLDLTAPLTITGAGAGVTIVDGNGAVTGDRVFDERDTAQAVVLQAMTIRNGSVPTTSVGGISKGGGILVINNSLSSLKLNLKNVILEGNHALTGGGLFASGSLLTMSDSQVYNNRANNGGGVALESGNDALIERSEFYSNTATLSGGGIYDSGSFSVPYSPLTLLDSNLHNNRAVFNGGAISIDSVLVMVGSVIEANHADNKGGGLYSAPRANNIQDIRNSTFSHNTSQFGGAIVFEYAGQQGGRIMLTNSTLSGNSVSSDGAGIYAIGNSKIQLYNVTIANNVLARRRGTSNPMRGGGVFFTDTSVISVQNTIIADNYYTNFLTTLRPDDCYNTQTTNSLNSLGWNLIETTSNCLISGTTFGNITGQEPQLGPLGQNFGATQTQALLPGSPAIEAGQQPACTNGNGFAIPTDQRGFARPGGPRCDIGAFEYYTVFSAFLPVVQR